MIKHNQDGAVNGVILSLIFTVLLLIATIAFAFWAFSGRQDYKNHTDTKIQAAVATAVQANSAAKDKQFAEELKNPLTTYNGPQTLGAIAMQYPKTWSAYINTGSGDTQLDAYFNPTFVPVLGSANTLYALHVKVLSQAYASVIQGYGGLQRAGKVTVSAYALPKVPSAVGSKVEGQISGQMTGTIVYLPLRSQTIQIETDGGQYLADFNNYILPNFSFSP